MILTRPTGSPRYTRNFDHIKSKAFQENLNRDWVFISRYGWHEVVEALLSGRNIRSLNLKDSQGKTALHFACVEGHDRVVELLLNLGATVEK